MIDGQNKDSRYLYPVKRSTLQSLLAVVQLFALAQIGVGGLIVPAIWERGMSGIERRLETRESCVAFQAYVARNIRTTSAWVIGVAIPPFVVASFAAVIVGRRGVLAGLLWWWKRRRGKSEIRNQKSEIINPHWPNKFP